MESYLGLYVENNSIKYAKVSKEKDNYRIDAFGMKFYSDASKAIEQIIQETNSANVQISVNLVDESYQYFNMFASLNKRDLDKAIKLEFDSYCTEKGYNPNSLETRYAFVDDTNDLEKIKVINVSENKVELNKIKQNFEGQKLGMILPIPMVMPNLVELDSKENVLIVNMEENTTITTIRGKGIYDIQKIDEGSRTILNKISTRENSYAKAYEILRNTTIYTNESQFLEEPTEEESENIKYLDDIMPTLYNIVGQVQKIASESIEKFSKIYITGTLSNINNIDLYFQEYLGDIKCEILRPYFIPALSRDINIKEYIEVNSAIALALQGLGQGIKEINFKQIQWKETLNKDIFGGTSKNKKNIKINLNDFKTKISTGELWLIRGIIILTIFIIAYTIFTKLLLQQIQNKQEEVKKLTTSIQNEIMLVATDTGKLNKKTTEYESLIEQLNKVNDKISDINENRDLIPNLLNQIMTVIDNTVQITSITNPTDKHIVIQAQSKKYPGLGYFKTRLKLNGILKNVVSGSSMKQGEYVIVTIEGDLP